MYFSMFRDLIIYILHISLKGEVYDLMTNSVTTLERYPSCCVTRWLHVKMHYDSMTKILNPCLNFHLNLTI
jgi:hypothetical protein